VIMCTNRPNSLDPAIRRRAADIFYFNRPNEAQRYSVLNNILGELGLSENGIKEIVEITGLSGDRSYGFTYSDLIQRLIPTIVLDAYPTKAVSENRAIEIANSMLPTSPFKEN